MHTSPYWKKLRAEKAVALASDPSAPESPPTTVNARHSPSSGDAASSKLTLQQPASWDGHTPRYLLRYWLEGGDAWRADPKRLRFDLECFAALISVGKVELHRLGRDHGPCWHFRSADLLWKYATFIRPSGAGAVTAHLWIYELLHGKLADKSLRVDHLCENKRCVNPRHLEAVTNAENVQRSIDRRGGRR